MEDSIKPVEVQLQLDDVTYHTLMYLVGDIDAAVDQILTFAEHGLIPLLNYPPCGNRLDNGCRLHRVLVTNKAYVTARKTMPANSPKLSLRRLVTHFVYNEMYEQYPLFRVATTGKEKSIKLVLETRLAATKLGIEITTGQLNHSVKELLMSMLKDIDEKLQYIGLVIKDGDV